MIYNVAHKVMNLNQKKSLQQPVHGMQFKLLTYNNALGYNYINIISYWNYIIVWYNNVEWSINDL